MDTIILTVRGGTDAIELIANILAKLQAHALDVQIGEFFTVEGATDGLVAWRAFRDRAISPPT